jgi:Ni,Fe-hydrogenase III small subunit
MIKEILARIKQGHRTIPYPFKNIKLPERFLGLPKIEKQNILEEDLKNLNGLCPVEAFYQKESFSLDMGKCVFCGKCSGQFISFTSDYDLSSATREGLIITSDFKKKKPHLDKFRSKILGKSLKLRQVSAGGCNACELDINVLNTLAFDLQRFHIQFVASPRHADGIVITGPVTRNMETALIKTYNAIAEPKIVVAVGSCAISGGVYQGSPQVKGIPKDIKVDLFIPGCPPHPMTILKGLISLVSV